MELKIETYDSCPNFLFFYLFVVTNEHGTQWFEVSYVSIEA